MVRGDEFCLTGSILESQYLRDGHGYNNSTGNLWVKMLKMAGVEALAIKLPFRIHECIHRRQIRIDARLIAGNCTDEWGFGYKALRKAVLLRPFDEYYEEVLQISIEDTRFRDRSQT